MNEHLPGGEILCKGLNDLRRGTATVEGLLLLIAAPRLTRCGVEIPQNIPVSELPEHDLFRQLSAEHGSEAYRYYRSLLRRLVSLENALEAQTR